MKIQQLRFKNLNSLYGEWCINFEDPSFTVNNIFSITGKTGSGKSTILDALCLALYGETPRLGNITKSANDIMSRGTAECYAEVLFTSQEGTFRCHWEQRRARKKITGKLQEPEHQISDASLYNGQEKGEIIENQKRKVASAIEEKTGMNFKRFTRSILLAQGSFDTFLKANKEDKSSILEQITGTEIYSIISRKVHERWSEEDKRAQEMIQRIENISVLKDEDIAVLIQDIADKKKEEIQYSKDAELNQQALAHKEMMAKLENEEVEIVNQEKALASALADFLPQRERLHKAQIAATLSAPYARLSMLRAQAKDNSAALTAQQAAVPEAQTRLNTLLHELYTAEQACSKAKKNIEDAKPCIQRVRLLDISMQEKTFIGKEERQKLDTALTTHQTLVKKHNQVCEIKSKLEKEYGITQVYKEKHAHDAVLISDFTGLDAKLSTLLQHYTLHIQSEKNVFNATKIVNNAEKEVTASLANYTFTLEKLTTQINKTKKAQKSIFEACKGKELAELQEHLRTLHTENTRLCIVASLKEHRNELKDGDPCPLCGACQHPFSHENVPSPNALAKIIEDAENLIQHITQAKAHLSQCEKDEDTARLTVERCQSTRDLAMQAKERADTDLITARNALASSQATLHALQSELEHSLAELGFSASCKTLDNIPLLRETLKNRLELWLQHSQRMANIEKELATTETACKENQARLEGAQASVKEKEVKIAALREEFIALQKERKELYGDKDPDEEERKAAEHSKRLEEVEHKAKAMHSAQQVAIATLHNSITTLQDTIKKETANLIQEETAFSKALIESTLQTEEHFNASIMPQDALTLVLHAQNELDNKLISLLARKTDCLQRIEKAKKHDFASLVYVDLLKNKDSIEAKRKALREYITEKTYILTQNTKHNKEAQAQREALHHLQEENTYWKELYDIIGSANGTKYRSFAQGLTFDIMIKHANVQLRKMSDRYALIRDTSQALELNVIDAYQAGEVRSVKNLSGGESFIISLSLALGLSSMASHKVRVDSLFLDEGFGTLDDEALETALDTLASLHHDGKIIGVISHVPALKERISTQISVVAQSNARSILMGPGCSRCTES